MYESFAIDGPEFSDDAEFALQNMEGTDADRNALRPIATGNAVARGVREVTAADVRDAILNPSMRTRVLRN